MTFFFYYEMGYNILETTTHQNQRECCINQTKARTSVLVLGRKLPTDIKSVVSFHIVKRRLLNFHDDKTVSFNLPSSEGVS